MLFDWLMACLLFALIGIGIYMVQLPDIGFDVRKVTLILVHKQIGGAALLLVCVRWIWRQIDPSPQLVEPYRSGRR